ncbi:MAG TPA: alpha-L-rhamnosidase C-terminal domain-containing protein [Acidimicrobiales bacterium]|nr:alpha-L-rhamnosidase C-terminal domain-containing protein [Acidimicrobiales bacterium]
MCRPRLRTRLRFRSLPTVALITVFVAAGAPSAVAANPSPAPQWPAHPGWQRYLETPATADITPGRVITTSGSVSGARALTDPAGHGDTTLTMTAGGGSPTIVVDYGKDIGGVPYFVVRSESGSPVLRSSYSEGRQYVGPQGDVAPSASGAGDPSRADDLTVAYPGTVTSGLIQGGERYEMISLVSPGSVTLSSIGIRFTAVRATAQDFRGWFDSSSPELNRIWYAGAYTTQLNELPAGRVTAPWSITSGALDADGGVVGVLRLGRSWTDYTMSFDTRVLNNDTGWVVRASSSSSGYLFILHTNTGGSPDTLQEIAIGPAEFTVVGDAVLPQTFDAGVWHHVSTVSSGPHITTFIDGTQVSTFDTGTLRSKTSVYGSGTVGFAALGSTAVFRDLDVTGPGGTTLYTNALARSSALADFPGPDTQSPDSVPVIMDGAKRDRVVWSGDLGVEVPNVFATTGAASFVRGSLQLLASYQVADGESGTNVDPTLPLGTFPQSGSTYSASYSMDEVNNIATYYLYTGDLSFVRSQWPMITRELAWNASTVDSRGLLVTDGTDGQDWDYYDGNKTGEVSAYNDIYFETLTSAALMADALGQPSQADVYRREATTLRTAINRYLLDPSTGLYALSNLQPSAVAQDGNSLAVLFGVAPQGRAAAILAALAKTLPSTPYGPLPFTADARYRAGVSPFVTNEEVDALFATGDTAAATTLLRTLWGYMDAPGPDDSGADWELVGADGSPGFGASTSLAHGWSSGATADLSSYVLGVQPSNAGFRTWSVRPHPGSLSWVEGDVPTPHGTIAVRWAQHRSTGRFTLQVRSPARTRGTISVPVPRPGAVVTVRVTTPGKGTRSPHSVTAPAGTASVSLTVPGGTTDVVDVIPR